jgi:hypothetical protein
LLAAFTRSSFSADTQRAKTASAISVIGMPSSATFITVHLPVPFWPAVSRILSTSGCRLVLEGQNVARDFDQVAIELALVPFGEDLVHFVGVSCRGRLA